MSTSGASGTEESCTCKWSHIDADDRKDLIVVLVGSIAVTGYIFLNILVRDKNNSLFKSWSFFLGFTTLVCFCYLVSVCRQRQSRRHYLRSLEVYREGLLSGPPRRHSDSAGNECNEMNCTIPNQSDTFRSNPLASQPLSSSSSSAVVTSDTRTKLPGLHVTHSSRSHRGGSSSASSASSSSSSPSSQLINGNRNSGSKITNTTSFSSTFSSPHSTFLKGIHRQQSTQLFDENNFEHSDNHHHVINLVTTG